MFQFLVQCLLLMQGAAASRLRYRAATYADTDTCTISSDAERFDCFPDANASQQACLQRGCCWNSKTSQPGAPVCYFASDFPSYTVSNQTTNGSVTNFALSNPATIFRPNMVHTLAGQQITYANGISRLRIYDPSNKRYEVPIPLFNGETPQYVESESRQIRFESGRNGFTLHSSDGRNLFSTTQAPLIFTDQFIQITGVVDGLYLYGLGELVAPFRKNFSEWQRYVFYTRDHGPSPDANLYGVHPFMMVLRADGSAHGFFFLNSNAMEIDLTPYPAITFRTIGGIIDLFLFEGPTPTHVIQQYHQVIAKPSMPPYWALGFHLCRYGYANDSDLMAVIQRTLDGGFPYDVQWIDIDHMDKFLDWTVDQVHFSNLSKTVDYLHSLGMHFVNIIDPAISNQQPAGTYPPYDDGHAKDVFIKAADGSELVGQVWPGYTVFPDFTHPEAVAYFADQAANFKKQIDFDGLWLDMNEPSNFGEGSIVGCTNDSLDNPPYVPQGIADKKLQSASICPSARQTLSVHYNLHSLYGYFETKTAYLALLQVMPNLRPFILTRSTFPGSGQWTNHWTGDIRAVWDDLKYSISQIMNFNMFGIPFTGADVCGFAGGTTEELCTRWMQLGAFYPFMRNHNNFGQKPQDPGVFSPEAQQAMRVALYARYEMLPYLYTLLFRAYVNGSMVAQPLFFVFNNDSATYAIDDQFMWGSTLMITPVVTLGATSRSVYFPNATWYDAYTGQPVLVRNASVVVSAPLSYIPLFLRGGSIMPCQFPALTTEAERMNPYYLVVALDEFSLSACGELFMDDGVSQGTVESGEYSLIKFKANSSSLYSHAEHGQSKVLRYSSALQQISILGIKSAPKRATVNKYPATFQYLPTSQSLVIRTFVDLLQPIEVLWF